LTIAVYERACLETAKKKLEVAKERPWDTFNAYCDETNLYEEIHFFEYLTLGLKRKMSAGYLNKRRVKDFNSTELTEKDFGSNIMISVASQINYATYSKYLEIVTSPPPQVV
jgi:hypothetical protein